MAQKDFLHKRRHHSLMPKKQNIPWKLYVSISSIHSDFSVIKCKGDQGYSMTVNKGDLRPVIFLSSVHFPRLVHQSGVIVGYCLYVRTG